LSFGSSIESLRISSNLSKNLRPSTRRVYEAGARAAIRTASLELWQCHSPTELLASLGKSPSEKRVRISPFLDFLEELGDSKTRNADALREKSFHRNPARHRPDRRAMRGSCRRNSSKMARKLPQDRGPRSAAVERGDRGTIASLSPCAFGTPGENGWPADQRRLYRKSLQWSRPRLLFPVPSGAPLDRAALRNALQRLNLARAASGRSLRKRSESLSLVGSLLRKGSGSSANSPRLSRRSISRLSRREAILLVLSKSGSSFAIARISFCESNHSSSSLSAGISAWDRKPRVSKADGVGRQKFNSLEGRNRSSPGSRDRPGLKRHPVQVSPPPWFWRLLLFGGTRL
jgi:hypothetical protein